MNLSQQLLWATPAAGVLALGYAVARSRWIGRHDSGTDRMREISGYIRSGTMAFLRRQYGVVAVCAAVIAALLAATSWNAPHSHPLLAVSFLAGASCSALAGYVGLRVATSANVRTTHAARRGMVPALAVAFAGGSVMGMCVVGLALIGLSGLSILLSRPEILGEDWPRSLGVITGFSLGASSMALFARVGGGIYTKAADVGAGLASELQAGAARPASDDDARNPAVIADNVGENVGDIAGMGADLFESYVSSIVAAMLLAGSVSNDRAMVLPLVIAAAGILVSMLATGVVRSREGQSPQRALSLGRGAAAALMLAAAAGLAYGLCPDGIHLAGAQYTWLGIFAAVAAGIVAGSAIGRTTGYYTGEDGDTVGRVARAAETGAATVLISGLAVGLRSTVWPVVVLSAAIAAAHSAAGLYGIALAALGMLSTTAMHVSVDAYGPIADNAGGIATLSGLDATVREKTGRLDLAGNNTTAIGKGFAIGSAALTALALQSAYITQAGLSSIDVAKLAVLVGLLLGATLPFAFSALALDGVARAAAEVIQEVRRQLKAVPGILTGAAAADYGRCVDVAAAAALRRMAAPAILAALAPALVGLYDAEALAGLLVGGTVSGVLLAIFQANAGSAWNNAKKHLEAAAGAAASRAHRAASVADQVGDPLKDTSGPALSILIKWMSVVAVVMAPLVA